MRAHLGAKFEINQYFKALSLFSGAKIPAEKAPVFLHAELI
jgi:hypothetical protein